MENFNPFARIRQDLFGCFDLFAVKNGVTLAVQVTSGDHLAARKAKLLSSGNVAKCLRAGWKIQVHGWARHKVKRGGKAYRFALRAVELTAADFDELALWTRAWEIQTHDGMLLR